MFNNEICRRTLDLTDAFLLRLQRTAAYRTEDGVTSLHLDGQAGYAEIPAINIRRSNFSISVRFNLQDIQSLQHILSDWSAPFQFRLYVSNSQVHVTLRRGGNVQDLLLMSSSGFVYYLVHVASHLFYQFAPFFLFFNLHAYYSAKLFLLFFFGGGEGGGCVPFLCTSRRKGILNATPNYQKFAKHQAEDI